MDQFTGGQPTKYFPADKEGIEKLKNLIGQIAIDYKMKKRKVRKRGKAEKKQDPFVLQKYKTEKFPGTMSKDIVN